MSDDIQTAPFLQNPITKAVFISTPDLRARGDLTPCWSADGVSVPPPPAPVVEVVLPAAETPAPEEPAPVAAPIQRTRRVRAAAQAPVAAAPAAPEPPTPEQFANEVAAALAAARE